MLSISRVLVLVLGLGLIAISTETHQTRESTSTSSAGLVAPPRKRGLAYINPPDTIQDFQTSAANVSFITWAYDWGSAMDPAFPAYLEYVPCSGAPTPHIP